MRHWSKIIALGSLLLASLAWAHGEHDAAAKESRRYGSGLPVVSGFSLSRCCSSARRAAALCWANAFAVLAATRACSSCAALSAVCR